jgi:hypothetical protein
MQYLLATRSYSEIFRSSPKYRLALGCSFSLSHFGCVAAAIAWEVKPSPVLSFLFRYTLLYQTFVIWNSSKKGRSYYGGERPECVLLWITLTFLEKLLLSIHPEQRQRALAAWLAGAHNKSERRWVVAKTSCRSRFVVLSLRCLAK